MNKGKRNFSRILNLDSTTNEEGEQGCFAQMSTVLTFGNRKYNPQVMRTLFHTCSFF